jgi:deoxyribodipyrimidine photolyase-like uncharacterized protein
MEVRQETDYVLHHAQKILAIFAAMRDLAQQLRDAGHQVHYIAIDDTDNLQSVPANIDALISNIRRRYLSIRRRMSGVWISSYINMVAAQIFRGSWLIATISIQTVTKCPTSLPDANNG